MQLSILVTPHTTVYGVYELTNSLTGLGERVEYLFAGNDYILSVSCKEN